MPEKTMEERKLYNAQYYAENKKKIIAKLCSKEKCGLCGREIIHNNVNQHMKTKLCQKTFQRLQYIKNMTQTAPVELVKNNTLG